MSMQRGTKAKKAANSIVKKAIAIADRDERGKYTATFKRFIKLFFGDATKEDLAGATAEELHRLASSAFSFAKTRTVGKPKIRVLTSQSSRQKKDAWLNNRTVIEIVNDDMPFLVDSVTAELERLGEPAQLIIHPVMAVKRDTSGKLQEVMADGRTGRDDKTLAESGVYFEAIMHIQVRVETDPDILHRIGDTLQSVLGDVRLAVTDWLEMRRQATRIAADFDGGANGLTQSQAKEVEDFLHWLHDDHYAFLGYRSFRIESKSKSRILHMEQKANLGVLRKRSLVMFHGVRSGAELPPQFATFLNQDSPLLIVKTNQRATVHRRVHYDVVAIKTYGKKGEVVGIRLFAGMFTADVYTNSPNFVPVLRHKIDRIHERIGYRKNSHDGKRLQNVMENLPRDELFESSDDYLEEIALGILHLQERSRTALFVRRDNFDRFVSCLVYVPRDRFDTQLRLKIAEILVKAFDGRVSSFFTQVTDSPLARLHFIIGTQPDQLPEVDVAALETTIAEAAKAWDDSLLESMVEALGEIDGRALHDRYAHAFPASYRENYAFQTAVFDIGKIEDLVAGEAIAMHLHVPEIAKPDTIHFKVYTKGAPLTLSDVIPVIENMGFKVIGEVPFQITPRGSAVDGGPFWIHDFDMCVAGGHHINPDEVRDGVHTAFEKVWSGEMESDGFNKLVGLAGLEWRDVVILRAYAKFLRQASFPFSQSYIEDAFSAHPDVARLLINLFMTRFDPTLHTAKNAKGTERQGNRIHNQILAALDAISSADEDRILRRHLNLIDSSLRTNFFQLDADGHPKSYVSIKLNSQAIDELPRPKPWREIFVYSPRVEAVHLRGGAVARGGLRWSDRREDFRSEVLGLVKAQMVKNAVIVPTGSKGGFVVKAPPTTGGRDAFQAEGVACYQIMQRGLLDITDNVVKDKIRPPKNVVRRDSDDPYLVVAADKGTATFSDIANAVSEEEYGHWLGDAYASGGTFGYDHKAMGITAKGAWESVKRHFREMGIDTQKHDFTAVGIGDMSGDVFGNGMLLSKHIRLLAAFNHLHIFIDPEPDSATSWKERNRLFKLGRSSWTDYNTKLISKGGGIFERSAKSLKISSEIKLLFGLEKADVTPNELMAEILKTDADLMWFGGIGTYVKAETESHGDAADRANDSIRIHADQVRVKVIGEGANLGVTQRGRIECGQNGVRLNTDAIDNSAGVDCSDHEVNIKILLNGLVQAKKLTTKNRNALLEQMTDEVSALVLRNNYQQTQTISVIERRGSTFLEGQLRAMKMMERDGMLDRALEFLPDDETIAERAARSRGLTRSEVSVLLPYTKMWLYDQIVESTLPDDPVMEEDLIQYFPKPIQKKFPDAIRIHKLRREIIATVATNSFINRVGASFLTAMMERSGMNAVDVARAYLVTRSAYGIRDLWSAIEALDNKVPADTQLVMLEEINSMIERSVMWLLRNEPAPLNMAATLKRLAPKVADLSATFEDIVTPEVTTYIDSIAKQYSKDGVPKALARKVATLYRLAAANDIARISDATKLTVKQVADAYFRVGNRFGLGNLRARARTMALDSHWQKLAVSASVEEIFSQQSNITRRIINHSSKSKFNAAKALDAWIKDNQAGVDRFDQLSEELRNLDTVSLAMLTVTNRQLAAMHPA